MPLLQLAALQRRLLEATREGGEGEESDGEAGDGFGGDIRRVLQHNKKIAAEMKAYAEVRWPWSLTRGRLLSVRRSLLSSLFRSPIKRAGSA